MTAPESGLVTATLKDRREFGFRPNMQDDRGNRVTVTIFRIGSPDEIVGEVETGVGKPAVESKSSTAFRIAVTKVASTAPASSR